MYVTPCQGGITGSQLNDLQAFRLSDFCTSPHCRLQLAPGNKGCGGNNTGMLVMFKMICPGLRRQNR